MSDETWPIGHTSSDVAGGATISFRAYLRNDRLQTLRRGRLHLTPGTEIAYWTPWPRRGRPGVTVTLLGGTGAPEAVGRRGRSDIPGGRGWRVRIGTTKVATLLIERNYVAAFAPALSLGEPPPPHRAH